MSKTKKKETRGRKPGKFYVDNAELIKEIRTFYDTNEFTEQLGKYTLRIVDGVAHSPNFSGYDNWLDDMRSDAIWRITKSITERKCSIEDDESLGDIKTTEAGEIVYKTDKEGEFILDEDDEKIPDIVTQNNIFGYFSMIAWRAFQNRIKIEKKFNNTSESYKEKIFEDFEQEYSIPHTELHEDTSYDENIG